MTYQEMEQLVAEGTWTKEVLAAQPEGATTAVGSGAELSKNINKFYYFAIETAHNEENVVVPHDDTTLLYRDYINKWAIEHNNNLGEVYGYEGNFGDGSKIHLVNRTMPENNSYNGSFYVKAVYGYRPTRKIIYVYKADPNTYLLTSNEEFLYTIDDLKIATADIAQ